MWGVSRPAQNRKKRCSSHPEIAIDKTRSRSNRPTPIHMAPPAAWFATPVAATGVLRGCLVAVRRLRRRLLQGLLLWIATAGVAVHPLLAARVPLGLPRCRGSRCGPIGRRGCWFDCGGLGIYSFSTRLPVPGRRVEIALTFHGYDRCTDGNSRKWRGSSNAPQMGARERPGDHRIPS